MKKISTLFKKTTVKPIVVTDEIDPKNKWVYEGNAIATRKFDGSACAIINGELYKRYDVKKGMKIPDGAIACQEADEVTGHHPHWIKCDRSNPADKYFFEGFDNLSEVDRADGTYEACGKKIQGNPEGIEGHALIKHGCTYVDIPDFSYSTLKRFLSNPDNDIEGIVFHNTVDGRMCKIRKKDFGAKRVKRII